MSDEAPQIPFHISHGPPTRIGTLGGVPVIVDTLVVGAGGENHPPDDLADFGWEQGPAVVEVCADDTGLTSAQVEEACDLIEARLVAARAASMSMEEAIRIVCKVHTWIDRDGIQIDPEATPADGDVDHIGWVAAWAVLRFASGLGNEAAGD